jgi:hypothetical protein
MQRCWQQASQLFDLPFEPVRIPYDGSWMPGYLLRPDTRAVRRPTVILNNGQDAQNVRMWARRATQASRPQPAASAASTGGSTYSSTMPGTAEPRIGAADLTAEEAMEGFGINVFGPIRVTHAFLPLLRAAIIPAS